MKCRQRDGAIGGEDGGKDGLDGRGGNRRVSGVVALIGGEMVGGLGR